MRSTDQPASLIRIAVLETQGIEGFGERTTAGAQRIGIGNHRANLEDTTGNRPTAGKGGTTHEGWPVFNTVADSGFNVVRLPVAWNSHANRVAETGTGARPATFPSPARERKRNHPLKFGEVPESAISSFCLSP